MKNKTVNNKLNIAMFGHKRIPSREGGVEVVVEEISVRMAKLGHNVVCYNRKGRHVSDSSIAVDNIKEYKGVKIKRVFTIDKKGIAAVTSSFFAALKTAFLKYDVVHIHAEGPCAMIFIPHFFGKKTVVTIHGLDWAREKWDNGFGSKYIKFGEKMAVKYADEIIVLSASVKDYFKNIYGRDTTFISNGVNRPQKRKADLITQKFGIEKDDYILYLGRIVPEKGLKYLINAYKSLNIDKKLVIAGGVSDTDEFAKELRSMTDGDERIIFTNFVQGEMLDELYSNAYIYVLPSDLEGMPLSLLEAMSYGNCCLTSDIPECADVVKDKGVIFKKGDTDDLKDKLYYLCTNEDVVKRYKSISADYICSEYGWDKVVEKTLKLYK